jgi:hypothetical protein
MITIWLGPIQAKKNRPCAILFRQSNTEQPVTLRANQNSFLPPIFSAFACEFHSASANPSQASLAWHSHCYGAFAMEAINLLPVEDCLRVLGRESNAHPLKSMSLYDF